MRLGDRFWFAVFAETGTARDEEYFEVEAIAFGPQRVMVRAVEMSDDPMVANEWTAPYTGLLRAPPGEPQPPQQSYP